MLRLGKKIISLMVVIFNLAFGIGQAQIETEPTGDQVLSPVKTNINWSEFLSRHDLVWSKSPMAWYNGPFLGNGMLGSVFFQEDDHLRINVGRSDVEDHQKTTSAFLRTARLPIGYFTIKTRGKITGFEGRLDLYNAEAKARVNCDGGYIDIRALVHSDDMLIIYQLTPSESEANLQVQWHAEKAIAPARKHAEEQAKRDGVENLNRHAMNWYKADYTYNPDPEEYVTDNINVCHQRLAEAGEYAAAWQLIDGPGASKLLIVSIEQSYPDLTALDRAVGNLKAFQADSFENYIERHRMWWHNYYPASFISLDDTRLESYYWIQVYKFASGARKGRAFMDVMGPWFTDSDWANGWYNLNTQLSYWFLTTANRLDIAESLFEKLDEKLPVLIKNMPARFEGQCAGLYTIAPQTFDSPFPESHLQSLGDLTWICHDYWMMLQRTLDHERTKKHFFPLLKKSVNTYLYVIEEGPDGKIHIPEAFSPEYPGGWGKDTNYNLAILRWGCQTLLSICEKYQINDPLIPKWKDILNRLTDYPVNENGYMIAADIPFEQAHRHYSHLLMIYPLGLVNIEQDGAQELMEKSVSHWISYPGPGNCGYSWSGASAMSALMEDGEKAAIYLDRFLRQSELYPDNASRLHPTTIYTETENYSPTTETPFSACDALQKMLLQSWGGKIRVFPAIPDSWKNTVFHGLLAEGGFEVSATRKGGKTQFVRIKSLAGSPCLLKTDIEQPIRIEGLPASTVKITNDGLLEIDIKSGEEIVIYSKNVNEAAVIGPIEADPEKYNTFGWPGRSLKK